MLTELRCTASLSLVALITFVAGCTGGSNPATSETSSDTATVAQSEDDREAHGTGQHDGWWCVEHGVPEGECSRCDASLIAGFKEKGDWCEKHDLPESQCFKCNPDRAENFIARYEAKYGKKPPEPTE